MSQPYVGEIRMFAGNFAPAGWATCDGQLIPISQNDTLFNLIGTTYGGDGVNTFALPNLAARVPLHQGTNAGSTYTLAQNGGVTTVTLTTGQIPAHSHPFAGDTNPGTSGSPANAYFANPGSASVVYANPTGAPHPPTFRTLNPATLPSQGGSQPHDNMQPYLAIMYIISLYGIYPSPT